MNRSEKFIITGGPGSGKTTLCNALTRKGFACFEESSRKLIKQESQKKDGILPWDNLEAFADLVIKDMLNQFESSNHLTGPCFFDRAIPDIFGYLRNSGFEIPKSYYHNLNQTSYNTNVFILPPWSEIFIQDSERPQTYDESVNLYYALRETYTDLGYRLWELPTCEPESRVNYIQNILAQLKDVQVS